jgi:DNA-binding LacI/PurR family transcriptional regulator
VNLFTMTLPHPGRVVTLQAIADRAGVAKATVSYALRGDEKIPAATRAKINELAERMGYRPNPRIAGLMAHIRRARGPLRGERLGFVWVHTSRREAREDPFLSPVVAGARQRADQLGYQLEEFFTDDKGMSDRRLSSILAHRGIEGVIFSPVMHEVTVQLDFDWSHFACAVIGNARWSPELHHSGHHHYHAMYTSLDELARLGCRRPAVILNPQANERGRRAWHAAFLAFHPDAARAARHVLPALPASPTALRRWLAQVKPDAIILHRAAMVRRVQAWLGADVARYRICYLNWSEDLPDVPGIDQRFDLVASNAVDLVVGQLLANERGVPAVPRVTLFPGQWVQGRGAARATTER